VSVDAEKTERDLDNNQYSRLVAVQFKDDIWNEFKGRDECLDF